MATGKHEETGESSTGIIILVVSIVGAIMAIMLIHRNAVNDLKYYRSVS